MSSAQIADTQLESYRGTDKPFWGILAEFPNPGKLFSACENIRDLGYRKWDAHSPFPVHGLERAMGLRDSLLPWVVLVMGLTGASLAMLLQWWISAVAYKLVIAGKPFFSWPAFIPVTFEIGVLFSALGAVIGMFAFNGLPRLNHPLFNSERFLRSTDDGFFISIEAADPNFDPETIESFLVGLGATSVEVVCDDS